MPSTSITNRFSRKAPVSMAQGRHGELIVVQGNGVRPARWSGSGAAVDAGMNAPESAPNVTVNGPAQYYVARVDINKPGACYYGPPEVSFVLDGSSTREAKAASYLNQASVGEIRVLDGGKGYTEQPSVELSDSHGKGAEIEAELDIPETGPDDPTNSKKTGLTGWEVVQGPPFSDELDLEVAYKTKWRAYGPVTIPITNGSGRITKRILIGLGQSCNGRPQIGAIDIDIPYSVSGVKNGTGAELRIGFSGHSFNGATCVENANNCFCSFDFFYSWGVSGVSASKYGANYADDETIEVRLPAAGSWDGTKYTASPDSKTLIIRGYTNGNENNTSAPRYKVKSLNLINGGSGYLVAPQIKITSDSGFGAYATCKVKNGTITEVNLENCGGGYKTAPKVEVVSGGAEAFAVSRPHLRGTYQCYYRYVDDTPEDKGGPIPSNLSPLKEIDAGEGAASLSWTFTSASGRAKKVELWRTTGDQAVTLYRVAVITGLSYSDSLTDEELRDADRTDYAAMPIVLPNGEVNANRFGIPPSDKSSVVRFQDRFWYGVDTGGEQPNTVYYSEVDEPESVPDTNEIILQQNAKDADRLRALIPFGSTLLLMQERHSFSLTFVKAPLLDAQVTPLAYRGCLNQRSWDIYGGVCYVLDQYGVYSITPTGQIDNLSDAIDNLFRDAIDFGATTWAFVLIDAKMKILRAFIPFREDNPSGYPTRVLCYSLDSKSWWFEKYPQRLTGGTQVRLSNGDFRCVYAGQSGPLLLNEGLADLGRGSITHVSLVNAGSGYRTPPTVRATGGTGATFQASINAEGKVASIWITSPGYGYTSGALTISAPDDPSTENKQPAEAVFTATDNSSDMPLYTTYRFKGGNAELVSEANNPEASSEIPRGITLMYAPQPSSCEVALRTYYNNSRSPRYNVASRNRGIGFTYSTVDAGARYDMAAPTTATGNDTGVATALFAGKTLSDIKSADRHVAVELAGARKNHEPVVFFGVDIAGTAEPKGG